MTAKRTSAGCADSWWSCFATASIICSALACGSSAARPPPPAHLDPEYADAGPPVLLHDPWPQNGPFHCHAVAAQAEATAMCSRSRAACEQWRQQDADKGFTVGACTDTLEATCLIEAGSELCFETPEQCDQVRDAMAAEAACRTIKAVWKPE